MKGANNTYFGSVKEAIKTTVAGAKLTVKHLKDAVTKDRHEATTANADDYFDKKQGIVTLQYPKEQIPVPDHGRYKLHNEMDDCIVCDKCAKICPVNCIDIEPIKSTETFGTTSDGTPKRLYAAKFDIDMAKCCFCGLCTTVCPTECLTMTKDYDFSGFDVTEMNFAFGNLTPDEAQAKREAYDKAQEAKQAAAVTVETNKKPVVRKAVRPIAKPSSEKNSEEETSTVKPKPVFKPKMKSKPVIKKADEQAKEEDSVNKPVYKPKIKPVIKAKKEGESEAAKTYKPKISAKVKPVIKKLPNTDDTSEAKPKYIPKVKTKIKPVIKKKTDQDNKETDQDD